MNGWIKSQIWADYRINEYDSLDDFINRYIKYYNYERPMYKLNYISPAEFTLDQGFNLSF